MPIVKSQDIRPEDGASPSHNLQVYGALDAAVTLEVFEALSSLRNEPPGIYAFERALQAPALEMALRGFRVDGFAKRGAIQALEQELRDINSTLQALAIATWGKTLNPRSHPQMVDFFFRAMRLPEIWSSKKGKRKLSLDREALEKLQIYFHPRPIISAILSYRAVAKRLEVLKTEIDPDGRMRTAYNIAGTETGRWSSSTNAWGTGTNLQNITPALRHVFIADEGMILIGIDLEQAESREVGWQCGTLFGDWAYLDACEGGDLHTTVCRMTWPGLGWTGDPKADRKVAETPFYRHLTYRDMAKKLGHGSNYMGTPFTLSRHAKIPQGIAEAFQRAYFGAFPGIPEWHRWVARELQTKGELTTPFGRQRRFFGRAWDDTTLREAIAYVPQSSTGDRMNLGLWRAWKHLGAKDIQILAQVHDAIYVQAPMDSNLPRVVAELLRLVDVPLEAAGRVFTVPGECKVGWNWGAWDGTKNPDGLKKWSGWETRTRTIIDILDRPL